MLFVCERMKKLLITCRHQLVVDVGLSGGKIKIFADDTNLFLTSKTLPDLEKKGNVLFFMKLFKTSNMEIVNCCQKLFGCDLPSTLLKQRFEKFIATL